MAIKPDECHALVIGAGIGGLATAIALRRAGYTIQVFERAHELNVVGAGLTLWPNGVRALRKLGLEALIAEHRLPVAIGGIYDWKGRILAQTRTSEVERLGGAPLVAVRRAELQAALLAALESLPPGEHPVRFGACLERFEQDEQGVTAYFTDGTHERGSVLIGADGLHSVVRQVLFGAASPRYVGVTAWRAVAPVPPDLSLLAGEYWGCGQEFGIVPLSGQRVYWFATRTVPAGQDDAPLTPAERKQALRRLFHRWHPAIPALIQATPADAVLRTDIYDRPPLAAWSRSRVTLLGDAAHPMTPNLGQGACQALEDAVALAASLHLAGTTDPIPQALQTYEAARLPRANRLVIRSRQFGAIIQSRERLTCWTRNGLIMLLPDSVRLKLLEPFIKHEM
jgi:2-polyprenyl-6-methoxyphenol hydroxylase-like FAD-dependent oxidoreductase